MTDNVPDPIEQAERILNDALRGLDVPRIDWVHPDPDGPNPFDPEWIKRVERDMFGDLADDN